MLKIGDIIRSNRIEQKISQEELAFGICAVSSLSRIENGQQEPSRTKYEQLMERMGLSPFLFPSFRSEQEIEVYRLKHEINQLFISNNFKRAEEESVKLKSLSTKEQANIIFIEYIDALLFRWNGGSPEIVLDAMIEVANKTIKDINPDKILNLALSLMDLSILNNLAISYYDANLHEKGINLLYSIKDYIEQKIVDYKGISPMYTAVLHGLSNWIGLSGDHNEVIKLCDLGIQRCIEYGAYFSFAGLLYNKGYALTMLGERTEARKYIQEAFFLNRARNKLQSCEIVKRFAIEHNIEIGD